MREIELISLIPTCFLTRRRGVEGDQERDRFRFGWCYRTGKGGVVDCGWCEGGKSVEKGGGDEVFLEGESTGERVQTAGDVEEA